MNSEPAVMVGGPHDGAVYPVPIVPPLNRPPNFLLLPKVGTNTDEIVQHIMGGDTIDGEPLYNPPLYRYNLRQTKHGDVSELDYHGNFHLYEYGLMKAKIEGEPKQVAQEPEKPKGPFSWSDELSAPFKGEGVGFIGEGPPVKALSEELDEPFEGLYANGEKAGGKTTTLKVMLALGQNVIGSYVHKCIRCPVMIRTMPPRISAFGFCTVCLEAHRVKVMAEQQLRGS